MSTQVGCGWPLKLLLRVGAALLVAAALLVGAPAAEAQTGLRAEAGLVHYANSDDLLVTSPWARAIHDINERWQVNGGWEADVISAASVDVITAATEGFDEVRQEAAVGAQLKIGTVTAGLGYVASIESDTHAHTVSASGAIELLSRNLTLGLNYGLSLMQLGTVMEPSELWRNRNVHQVDVSATQVLGRATIGTLSYTLQARTGLLSSPYQRVPLFPRDQQLWSRDSAQWVAERHPEEHFRHALALSARHSFSSGVFVNTSYRGYLDSWAMRANSAELGLDFRLGEDMVLEASNRFHWQSSVSFYRPVYTVNRAFITRDRKLSKMMTNIARLALRPSRKQFESLISFEMRWTRYDEHYGLVGSTLTETPDVFAGVFRLAFAYEP